MKELVLDFGKVCNPSRKTREAEVIGGIRSVRVKCVVEGEGTGSGVSFFFPSFYAVQ
jgi:hypothetical protein